MVGIYNFYNKGRGFFLNMGGESIIIAYVVLYSEKS